MTPIRLQLRVVLALAIMTSLGSTLAQTLPEALARASERSGVISANLDLEDALAAQRRTEADPVALRLDLVQAEQATELARAEAQSARLAAYEEIASAYLQALEADAQADLAQQAAGLAAQALEITGIRRDRGAATELDVRDAENDLASAESDLAAAQQGAMLAREAFSSLTGLSVVSLTPVSAELLATELPDTEEVAARLATAPTLLQATHGVELSAVALDLLDPSYAAARDIEAAETRLAQAENSLAEARRGLELNLQSLVDSVHNARERLSVAEDALANALERDDVDASRLAAGLIAEIAYAQTRLATRQAELALLQAQNNLLRALLSLQSNSGVAIEGLDAF